MSEAGWGNWESWDAEMETMSAVSNSGLILRKSDLDSSST